MAEEEECLKERDDSALLSVLLLPVRLRLEVPVVRVPCGDDRKDWLPDSTRSGWVEVLTLSEPIIGASSESFLRLEREVLFRKPVVLSSYKSVGVRNEITVGAEQADRFPVDDRFGCAVFVLCSKNEPSNPEDSLL